MIPAVYNLWGLHLSDWRSFPFFIICYFFLWHMETFGDIRFEDRDCRRTTDQVRILTISHIFWTSAENNAVAMRSNNRKYIRMCRRVHKDIVPAKFNNSLTGWGGGVSKIIYNTAMQYIGLSLTVVPFYSLGKSWNEFFFQHVCIGILNSMQEIWTYFFHSLKCGYASYSCGPIKHLFRNWNIDYVMKEIM